MYVLFHMYGDKKTYIFVSYLSFGDNVKETKSVLDKQMWKTIFFYFGCSVYSYYVHLYGNDYCYQLK